MAERGARLLVADDNKVNRLLLQRSLELQGHQRRTAPRTAGSRSRCCAREPFDLLLLDMEMPEMDGFAGARAAGRRPRAARPAGDRHLVARRRRPRRALHRARRRRLPAQAGEPGAAEGAHRLEPREEAPARPAEGAGAALRDLGGRAGPAAVGLRARRPARARHGDVLPTSAASPRWSRSQPPEETIELLNTWYTLMFDAISGAGRRRQPDDRRRADGDLRRAAAARRPRRAPRCARRST